MADYLSQRKDFLLKQVLCEFGLIWISRLKYSRNEAELMRMRASKMDIVDPELIWDSQRARARSARDYIIALVWLKSFICLAKSRKIICP